MTYTTTPTKQILLFYKFINLQNHLELILEHKSVCRELDLVGRILISPQGINGTIEGTLENTEKYIEWMNKHPQFCDIWFKKSEGVEGENAFPKMSIKARNEVVTLDIEDKVYKYGPNGLTGKYLKPNELHDWIHNSDKEFYIVDMRNDYEFEVGKFKNSILPFGMKNFRDLPEALDSIKHLKNKTIVTCCTGGIRCEIATGFLLENGFTDVYQIEGGIVSYMKEFPNEDFEGKLFVFDKRVLMGFNTGSDKHLVIGKCRLCTNKSENLVDYYLPGQRGIKGTRIYGIVCKDCIEKGLIDVD